MKLLLLLAILKSKIINGQIPPIIDIPIIPPPDCLPEDQNPNRPDVCCTSPLLSDDNPPDECLDPSMTTLNFIGTGICNENLDCCRCSEINVLDARSFICGGDLSCRGVKINLFGNILGASLNCNGDQSCEKCIITGDNLIGIRCDGDQACRESEMYLNQNSGDTNPQGILFPCNGDYTCKGSKITAKKCNWIIM